MGEKPMTWFRAFIVLLGSLGSSSKLTRLKSLCLYLAITGFLYTPFFISSLKAEYGGHRPPEVPLIRTKGLLKFDMRHTRHRHGLEFETDQGATYVMAYQPPDFYDWVWTADTRTRRVYMEGFLLRDRKGSFEPTFIASEQGMTLVSREHLKEAFIESTKMPAKTARFMYSVSLVFAVVSIMNMYLLKRRALQV